MDASNCFWIALFLVSAMTSDVGVFGRAVDSHGFLSRSSKTAEESSEVTLRMDMLKRGTAEAQRDQCAKLAAPWLENTLNTTRDDVTLLKLRVRPFSLGASRGLVFPGKSLFSLVRQVYRCCQEGVNCRSVKGIQGRLRGDADLEFVVTREILSLAVFGAELHFQLSNPQHLEIQPLIPFMAKHNLPTRYTLKLLGDMVELRVDLLFLFQTLHEMAGGARPGPSLVNMRRAVLLSSEESPGEKPSLGALQDTAGDAWGEGLTNTLPALDLGLILGCSWAGSGVPCRTGGVRLTHAPFIALYYRSR
ncbi:uncharacterized protein si:ch211-170d8.2 [Melanotaenia boesemani]|uniref:uncharacterized protein si:ch211-170d8.2 n=1 Tax=Melanotaenia boesemani TaxID=1250792 RepID=UPI001C03A6D1|nr:uncharacterized protein si:ch211-170d8.2 [Melanotaenia boesemani]